MVNVTRYSTPEGKSLADLMTRLNSHFGIGLLQNAYFLEIPNDDDGSFIRAGIPAAVAVLGSFPYAEPHYHLLTDTPDRVDIENVRLATQLALATVLHLDLHGAARPASGR